jgi:hypothetical protein
MQITRPRGEYIEKIVRDTNGRLVRLSFCVYENGGHVKARLLNATYLSENGCSTPSVEQNYLLACSTLSVEQYQEIFNVGKIVSPYFNSNLLNFLGSKPRAPTV